MSIYIGRGEGPPAFLASNRGWWDVCYWIDSLPAGADELERLREYGWSQDLPRLRTDIRAALASTPPTEDVADILSDLIDLAYGEDDDAIVVTDGMAPNRAENESTAPHKASAAEVKPAKGKAAPKSKKRTKQSTPPASGADTTARAKRSPVKGKPAKDSKGKETKRKSQ